jgi:hypothetical protein
MEYLHVTKLFSPTASFPFKILSFMRLGKRYVL